MSDYCKIHEGEVGVVNETDRVEKGELLRELRDEGDCSVGVLEPFSEDGVVTVLRCDGAFDAAVDLYHA